MSLLNCPECGKKFSSLAEMCPECGCPTAVAEASEKVSSVEKSSSVSAKSTAPTPKSSTLDLELGNDVIIRFASIPAGTFSMGSPEEESERFDNEIQHKVTISKPFYMCIHQVTQAQYKAVMDENPSNFKGDNLPVENVSWLDAMEFCVILSAKSGRKVRLPTEAEWEYACRAGTTTPFSFGEIISTKLANYDSNTDSNYARKVESRKKTTPVGSFPANQWGLYDMHGNVWEWCSDWYEEDYSSFDDTDPKGASTGTERVLRGGSWDYSPRYCRSASRFSYVPGNRVNDVGFRLALD